jgi:hypothetical protein
MEGRNLSFQNQITSNDSYAYYETYLKICTQLLQTQLQACPNGRTFDPNQIEEICQLASNLTPTVVDTWQTVTQQAQSKTRRAA